VLGDDRAVVGKGLERGVAQASVVEILEFTQLVVAEQRYGSLTTQTLEVSGWIQRIR
jgi:hypothetical protein